MKTEYRVSEVMMSNGKRRGYGLLKFVDGIDVTSKEMKDTNWYCSSRSIDDVEHSRQFMMMGAKLSDFCAGASVSTRERIAEYWLMPREELETVFKTTHYAVFHYAARYIFWDRFERCAGTVSVEDFYAAYVA